MPLSKGAIEAVRREARLFCFGFLAGQEGDPMFAKFEDLQKCLYDFLGESYSENITIEDYDLWYREYTNAKPR